MRKVIAAINMTIDGFCDHTAISPDEEIHDHYTALIKDGGVILYGKATYLLMEYWRPMVENPSGKESIDDFAKAIDEIPKIVFSHTLKNVDWHSAQLSNKPLDKMVLELKDQPGKDILIGSRSLIVALLNQNLIDEFQLCVHPVLVAKGLPLFDHIHDRTILKLANTKTFGSGAIILYYEPAGQ